MIEFCNRKNYLFVGRGATGIFLILKNHFKGKKVLLPANICYAAVYPVIYSGNIPVFCDVNSETGNLTLECIKSYLDDISAIVVPHMFGNPVAEIKEICEVCNRKKILIIEDCASAMGAEINDKFVGSYGDYVIFSTGYSKTIDLGNGGMIFSDNSLHEILKLYKKLPVYDKAISDNNQLFSRAYRQFRNSGERIEDSDFFEIVTKDLSRNFLYRLPDSFEKRTMNKLIQLKFVIEKRRYKNQLYDKYIEYDNHIFSNYQFTALSVPWRKNLFVEKIIRKPLIQELLNQKIPVSDWYPVVTNIFFDTKDYPNAQEFENKILNFPLLIPDDEIIKISLAVNNSVQKIKENKECN